MKFLRSLLLLSLLSHSFGCAQAAPVQPKTLDARQQTLQRAANLILACQGNDGSLMMGTTPPQEAQVVPYFSNIAALGLVDAFRELPDPRYLAAARQWVGWYDAHRNPDGTIYDYSGGTGQWHSVKEYDSTDSYAATYIALVLAIHRAQPDEAWLKAHLPFVEQSIKAIQLTLQPNSLTIAKPTWPVMYTMDNIEVLLGVRSAAEIFKTAGQAGRAAEMKALADANESSIERDLWMADKSYYRIGIQIDGGKMEGLAKWYPDIMANVMAVSWLPSSPRHVALYKFLKEKFPEQISAEVNSEDDLDRLVWWGLAAKSAGDTATLEQIRMRLNGFDSKVKTFYSVALPGHVCYLLSNNPAAR